MDRSPAFVHDEDRHLMSLIAQAVRRIRDGAVEISVRNGVIVEIEHRGLPVAALASRYGVQRG